MNPSRDTTGRRSVLPYWIGISISGLLTLPLIPPLYSENWFRRPLSDDAYYCLVIARNLARGSGITFGGMPTTGFQPLYLTLCLIAGSIARWDPIAVPMVLTLVNWLLYNALGTWLIAVLWRRLHPAAQDSAWGPLAPFVWLVNPEGQSLALNGLESTLSLLSWLLVALVICRHGFLPRLTRHSVSVGFTLGIAFLARNDSVVLAAGYTILCSLILLGPITGFQAPSRRDACRSVFATLGAALCCATPWLVYNALTMKSLIPQGGRAELAGGLYDFGRVHQLKQVVEAVVRDLSPLPLPLGILPAGMKLLTELLLLGAVLVGFGFLLRFATVGFRRVGALLGCSLFVLALIYATLFGAPHMARRWLAPYIILGVLLVAEMMELVRRRKPTLARWVVPAVVVALLAGRVGWVAMESRRTEPTNTWGLLEYIKSHDIHGPIGAFQAGLLAWVLPDVINLDGKTNPDALKAHLRGEFGTWLAGSRVATVVDSNLLGTEHDPVIRSRFEMRRSPEGVVLLERRQ